jgi:hypothetical protein
MIIIFYKYEIATILLLVRMCVKMIVIILFCILIYKYLSMRRKNVIKLFLQKRRIFVFTGYYSNLLVHLLQAYQAKSVMDELHSINIIYIVILGIIPHIVIFNLLFLFVFHFIFIRCMPLLFFDA